MKLTLTFLTAALLAAPVFASDWNSAVTFETIEALEVPAPAAARVVPRDGQNYSSAEEILIKEFDLTGIAVAIPETEVIRQDRVYANTFCFELAFRQALANILENYAARGSALSDTLEKIGAAAAPSKMELKKARQKLLETLNAPGSAISFVSPYLFNQPANGEKVEKNWIFHLRLGGKSYWAIVDRSGQNEPYNYSAE